MWQWSVGRKVAAGFVVILAQALAAGLFGLWLTSRTSTKLNRASLDHLPETELASQVEREVLNARIHFIYFVTIQKEGSLEKGWIRFRNAEQIIPKLQQKIDGSPALAGLRPEVAQLHRDFDSYQPVLKRIIEVVQKHQNRGPKFDALLKEWARLGGAMVDSAGRLSHQGSQSTEGLVKESSAEMNKGFAVLAAACCLELLIGITLAVAIGRNISRTLRRLTLELDEAANQVTAGASQISSAARSLAEGASQQAASLEETSASSAEINAMARKNAGNSKAAAANMAEASARIEEAVRNLAEMERSMDEITSSSDKISKIIRVIDEIAFQTNILALNAAVEAARAGAAGMGFGVVADEVRNLAQRSAQAAKDTAALIEESIARSNAGKSKLGQVAAAVRSVTDSARKVTLEVDEVKAGSEEQSTGIEQVSRAIAQTEQVTQSAAASAEQTASASAELNAQSESLRAIVSRLDQMVAG
jgi:uncharacterized phage infection (PIP) family protein YhgE